MTMLCYQSSKSMMTAACYKGGKSIMTSLIIMKIKVVYLQENEFSELRVKSYATLNDHKSCDYGIIIALLFGMSSNKRVII